MQIENKPCRRSIRLKYYDYAHAGGYFITICTHNRINLFGNIVDGEMRLNEMGKIVEDEWLKSKDIRQEIELDEWIIMPNHIHGIVYIIDRRGVRRTPEILLPIAGDRPVSPTRLTSKSIGSMIAGFKSVVTKRINQLRQTAGQPIWQRNYYEHVIRNEKDLNQIREYIFNNPLQWDIDAENINKKSSDIQTMCRIINHYPR